MAEIFRMPAVSPTMETGTIAAWRIAEGQRFASGTVIAEVGTDKATMEAEIYDEGVLLRHLVAEGDEVPLNAPIAIFGAAGEAFDALEATARAELAGLKASGAPVPATAAPAPVSVPTVPPAAPAAAPPAPTAVEPAAAAPIQAARAWMGRALSADFSDPPGDLRLGQQPARVSATPLARRVAELQGVDLRRVRGTGLGGRIVRQDVEAAAKVAEAPSPPSPARRPDVTTRPSQMRRTIAKRLLASHQDIPTFFLTVNLDVSAFVSLREAIKASLPDVSVSYNDMLLAAVARSLRDYPAANVSWTDAGVVQHGRVDVGVAVALPDGLITPVLRDADTLRLSEIASAVRGLATRAKEGKLQPEEYTGGTFTVSNLGMMGIDHFTAIINPPEAAILAVGRVAQEPAVVGGRIEPAWRMKVTMTCDHRVIDGAVGAGFLQVLRRYVETPSLLLV